MVAERLLDESSLRAIKTYVDSKAEESGKVDDVKINSTSVVTSKVANIAVEGTYNSSTNKIATQSTITDAINALDVSNISGFGVGKTLATLTETDGKIAATFQDIQLASTAKVTGLDEALASKVPTSRTIAGIDLVDDVTSSELVGALGLSSSMSFVGVSTTDPKGSSGATISGHSTWKKGEVVIYKRSGESGYEEYVNIDGSNTSGSWELLGDADSYALNTITISAGSGLSGGGNLQANRTISHATPSGAQATETGFHKFSTDGFGHVNGTEEVTKEDLTGLGVADDSKVVHNTGDETIEGRKTFGSAPVIFGIYNTTKNDNIVSFGYSTGTGSIVTSKGHFIALGDDDGSDYYKPKGTFVGDLDTYYYNTGIALVESDNAYKLSFPEKSGTFALTSDIPSLSDYVKGPSSATDGRIAVFDGATGKLIKDGGTLLSDITSQINSHVNNTNIHVLSAEKKLWNEKADSVEAIEVSGATDKDNYTKLRYSTKKSPTATPTYTDIISTLSYNETLAILQG